jgi:hypothetical protein
MRLLSKYHLAIQINVEACWDRLALAAVILVAKTQTSRWTAKTLAR